jgi:hypothetical protein
MTKPLTLVKALDAPSTSRSKREKLKPRRQRRQELRDRAAKVDVHKNKTAAPLPAHNGSAYNRTSQTKRHNRNRKYTFQS